ncbi:hypothetical protein CFC21_006391 [Triticum aestivum]|uniref:Uncharacterized protein n=2 Tax=Triticum aestivum TaxID=4565 RepID=A0A9R1DBS8_WHEAT|nr:hypothetical protein CFC21_006391 [Triticum aestivum]
MDASTSPTTPLGPMTRARAKAIKDKVNSLLSELPLSTHETWLLPQVETICVIRYLEEGHGTATSNGEDDKDTEYEGQEEELPKKLQPPDNRSEPDVRRLKLQPPDDRSGPVIRRLKPQPAQVPAIASYSKRTSVQDWTTGNTS